MLGLYQSRHCAVHPRLRGELIDRDSIDVNDIGSSPLTRGTLWKRVRKRGINRFIPAYAGNSDLARCFGFNSTGSSPLTRGTRNGKPTRILYCRFIPAYAGNSLKQGIEHLTNSSKDFLSGKYAKNPETVLNHFKNSSLD